MEAAPSGQREHWFFPVSRYCVPGGPSLWTVSAPYSRQSETTACCCRLGDICVFLTFYCDVLPSSCLGALLDMPAIIQGAQLNLRKAGIHQMWHGPHYLWAQRKLVPSAHSSEDPGGFLLWSGSQYQKHLSVTANSLLGCFWTQLAAMKLSCQQDFYVFSEIIFQPPTQFAHHSWHIKEERVAWWLSQSQCTHFQLVMGKKRDTSF